MSVIQFCSLRALVFSLGAIVLAAPSTPLWAGELASMHRQHMEGGRVCMSSHTHTGQAAPFATRDAAIAAAIVNWQDYTVAEYGPRWGRFALAAGKDATCKVHRGKWGCHVYARPCRLGQLAETRKRMTPRRKPDTVVRRHRHREVRRGHPRRLY